MDKKKRQKELEVEQRDSIRKADTRWVGIRRGIYLENK